MVAGAALAALHPRSPRAAAAWVLGVEGREVGTVLVEGWRKFGAAEEEVCDDWWVWWRAAVAPERCRPLNTPGEKRELL